MVNYLALAHAVAVGAGTRAGLGAVVFVAGLPGLDQLGLSRSLKVPHQGRLPSNRKCSGRLAGAGASAQSSCRLGISPPQDHFLALP